MLYSALVHAVDWIEVVSEHPDIARALDGLYRHLSTFDVFVMSNGAKEADAYLLHVARLAGVNNRVVNLGALAGGYMSALYAGATALVGPSHYVAYNQVVSQNARGLPVKVCYPVMDAARVLEAARSCFPAGRGDHMDLRPTKFLMVGRMATTKAPGLFVRTMAILDRRVVRWGGRTEGVVVGGGPLLPHMKTLARSLNATVIFKGNLPVDAVPCEVQEAHALVVPSTAPDTFGMVGPEAMLLGVPVVTFGFGGTGELVRHMENGILVMDPTPRALANALELLLTDTALRDRLGAQAQSDARRALSLPDMVACHTKVFMASA